jgi:hypothetical protein
VVIILHALPHALDSIDTATKGLLIEKDVNSGTGPGFAGDVMLRGKSVRGADVGVLEPSDFDGFGKVVGCNMRNEAAVRRCFGVAACGVLALNVHL